MTFLPAISEDSLPPFLMTREQAYFQHVLCRLGRQSSITAASPACLSQGGSQWPSAGGAAGSSTTAPHSPGVQLRTPARSSPITPQLQLTEQEIFQVNYSQEKNTKYFLPAWSNVEMAPEVTWD